MLRPISPEFLAYLLKCCKKHDLRFLVGGAGATAEHLPASLRTFALTETDLPERGKVLVNWRNENDGMPLEKGVQEIMRCHLGGTVHV